MSVAEAGVRVVRAPLVRVRRGRGILFWAAVGVLSLMVVVALFAPLLAPYDPLQIDLSNVTQGSTAAHPLGTDQAGRDILSRLMYGTRSSLLGPLGVVVVSTVLGVLAGVTAAWRGGFIDTAISRTSDLLFAFPGLLLAILAVSLFGTGLVAPVIALAIAYTHPTSRDWRGARRSSNATAPTSQRAACRASAGWRSAFATWCPTSRR